MACWGRLVKHYGFLLLMLPATGAGAAGPNAYQVSNPGGSSNQVVSGSRNPSLDQPPVSLYCELLSRGTAQSAALAQACQFALFLSQQLPDVICTQETLRYRDTNNRLGFGSPDTVTAQVSYEEGRERYSDLVINGKPTESATPDLAAAWSTGEFVSALRALFSEQSQAEFKFKKFATLKSTPALVFEFHITQENNKSWHLQVGKTRTFPGYSGQLWISQDTYRLMRLERTDIKAEAGFPIQQLTSVIDYADIELGDGTRLDLPVESETVACRAVNRKPCWRNVLKFRNWHKFRAQARILADAEPQPTQPTEISVPETTWFQMELEETSKRYAGILTPALDDQSVEGPSGGLQAASDTRAEMEALGASKQAQSQTPPAVSNSGSTRSDSSKSMDSKTATVFKVDVKLVPVRVVVRGRDGHAVGTLRKEDFQLFDKGKLQDITQFEIERSTTEGRGSADKPATVENRPPVPERFVVFLFDDLHLEFGDLAHARDAFERHLATLQPNDRAAILTTSGKTALDFTDDREKLHGTAELLQPHPLMEGSSGCPQISYYVADLIENKRDTLALQAAVRDAARCGLSRRSAAQMISGAARRQLAIGEQESRASLEALKNVVRWIARKPYSRSIILVSPGFLTPRLDYAYSEIIEQALRSEVIINTLDARGVYVIPDGAISTQYAIPEAAAMADVLNALSDGTGGTFFRNNNDLREGFNRLAAPPEFSYMLGFAPKGIKPDGKFHSLKVTVKSDQKLTLQARRGYYAPTLHDTQLENVK